MSRITETQWTSADALEKLPGETLTRSANFENWLADGVTVSACAITVEDADGTDKTATMLEGVPSVSSPSVTFRVKGGTSGQSYAVVFTLTFSNTDTNIARKKLIVR